MNWKLAYAPHEQCLGKIFSTIRELEDAGFDILPASVPGNFEMDLMKAGKMKDLYYSVQT